MPFKVKKIFIEAKSKSQEDFLNLFYLQPDFNIYLNYNNFEYRFGKNGILIDPQFKTRWFCGGTRNGQLQMQCNCKKRKP